MEKETQPYSYIKQIHKETHKDSCRFVITVSAVEIKTDGTASC